MHIRGVLGVLGWVSILIGLPQAAPAADISPDHRYTLFVELRPPYEASRAALQKMLKAEEYESFAEGERQVVLVLTEAQIGKLFQARVRFRKVGASASDRIITEPYLEGARIPGRFGKLIRRVYFDPQRG